MNHDYFFWVWLLFRGIFVTLIFIFLISGVDDLFIDIVYYTRLIRRKIFMRNRIKEVTLEQLEAVPQKLAAILIPAWDESNVILRMLSNTVRTVDYRHFVVFAGAYPNDQATCREVQKARQSFQNIELIVTPADGPTNKADCLNWVYQGVKVYEKKHNVRFEFFVFQDSEDVVHPLSLKYYNFLMPRSDFIQIPVFPFEMKWRNFIVGTYMDEFAENHTKDMRVREIIGSSLPSAGVGTALSRAAMDYLAEMTKNQIFDITSLTEDYMMGLKLEGFGGKKIFLQQNVVRVVKDADGREQMQGLREPLATREYFPNTFRDAVRQKSRWILGIAMQGWRMGWSKHLGSNYFLYRDRKSLLMNLSVIFGYLVVAYVLFVILLQRFTSIRPPPLFARDEIYYTLMLVIMCMFVWRTVNRLAASWQIYGPMQGLLSIPRLFFGNILNFCATWMAIRRYITSRISGKVPEWGKTAHAFPTEEQLHDYRLRLGDVLLDQRMVTVEQLDGALAKQKQTGGQLGRILVDDGVLWEEDLVAALARQNDERAAEIDPYATPDELLAVVSRSMAESCQVFPVGEEDGLLILATSADDRAAKKQQMESILKRAVNLRACAAKDLEFAISRAYGQRQKTVPPVGGRLGNQLLKKGKITDAQLKEALRRQKRSGKRIGDVLVEMQVISSADVEEVQGGL